MDGLRHDAAEILERPAPGVVVADPDGALSPVQQAFSDCHGLQCGFCTPGFLTTITAGLRDNPDPTEDEAREMVLGTIGGAIAMASEPSAPALEELRNSVTSKGGTTAAGLNALNGDNGLSDRLHATLQAAYDRAVELR